MENGIFKVGFDTQSGCINSIIIKDDNDSMNWCRSDGNWGYVHQINYDNIYGDYKSRMKIMQLKTFTQDDDHAVSVYSNGVLNVRVERFFDSEGNLREKFIFKNEAYADLFLCEHNCSIEIPFDDRYTFADDCLVHNCNTHIWCGLDTTYVNALKMGESENNLGLSVINGSFDSYSMNCCKGNDRGIFLLNLSLTCLKQNEEAAIEWVIFKHKGKQDFNLKALNYPHFIKINSDAYTVFGNESINFTADFGSDIKSVRVYTENFEIPFTVKNNRIYVNYNPEKTGDYRIFTEINGIKTFADFTVKTDFETLVKNRIDFIVSRQQYIKSGSSLDGAYLIYDNAKNHMIFEDCIPDHNASAERVGMGLLIAKYLQTHKNDKYKRSLDKYIEFIIREIYDEETGYVYGTVGKNQDRIRLYNAPWISMLFTEMYLLEKDGKYLDRVMKLFRIYYSIGGDKFYPNGISILRTLNAFKTAGRQSDFDELYAMFRRHVDNMVKNGTSYPKHEVNYEQTIVSPAATFISEFAIISGEEKYLNAAKIHIETLDRFSGEQPSCHMNEIPIRYWDDYWFGKSMQYGDTFPHYWSCLTARSFNDYYKASKVKKYSEKATECIKNCMCLFTDDGRGSAAYIYPYKTNERSGEKFDDWANDQDFALYFALETELIGDN